jgi:hypothetical protein
VNSKKENKLLSEDILDILTRSFIVKEVRSIIKNLNSKKAPDYDLITNEILAEIKFITQLYNAVLRRGTSMEDSTNYYNPEVWQMACRTYRII